MQINSIESSKSTKTEPIETIDLDSSPSKNDVISVASPEATADIKPSPAHLQSPSSSQRPHIAQSARQTHSSFSIIKNEEFEFEVPEEAPIFVPNEQEFKNPLTYISKIRPIAEKYGICKIRPPPTWQPPFTVDVDKLRFTPRVQRLNELEAKTRVKLNFLDQIAKFWELQGSSLKIPMVERKALDLYSLHRLVQEEGGLECTTNGRKWSKIANRLGYPVGKSVGTILKGHYERILYPFDVFTSGKEGELKPKLEPESDDHDYKPHGIPSRQNVTPPTETTARRSQRFMMKSEIKTEDECCDDVEMKSPSKRVTPQKNGDSKLGSSASEAAANSAANARAELRRLQIFGAGPKMPGIKSKSGQQSNPTTPTKSRMNGGCGGGGGSGGGQAARQQRQQANRRNHADPLAKYICHICTRGDGEEAMLLCDGCDDSYHTFCLIPPLADIPKGDWRCPKCVVEEVSKPVEAFGFEQAQREYTLQQFGEMADQFKADYFNIPVHLVPTELVEREFWRIVSSIDEDVAVEYGADLHTMDHGSGFPTKNSLYLLPGDLEYADSSWNLNNLPLLEESVLGHINADISGMKVPWMYVGMCFATFCWHNEDHWSYSINYLHWGEPKTWYGVPGSQAEAFENTMRSAAPELFQSQPDLLHQLVTIMNPNTLMHAGVPVYRTDQHAGEFVITFPRAYHAGFNQGYNFAEAVNFAPADWIKMGRECINHYSNLRRFCVFSHDELVCKMALDPDKLNLGIATACYLDMAEMVDTEKKLRKCLLEWGVTKAEREAFELIPDDERQCDVCKTTCFLSAVTCTCVKSLVCLRHYSELCKCAPEKHTLKYRYTLDELPLMLRKLKVKAESFETWITKVRDVLDPTTPTTMTLDELQELAQEAEDKKFPSSVLLERLNSAVLEAEKCVTVIQQLDINKVRTRTRNSSCEIAKYKLTIEELDMFVQEIDNLCCVIKEGSSVRELQQIGKEFAELATYLLKEPINEIKETAIEKMIEEGSALCIELQQMKPLKALLEKVKWYNNVRETRESDEKIPLSVIKKFLSDGQALAVVGEVDDTLVQQELHDLQSILMDVEEWEADSKKCFESGTQHDIPEIEDLLNRANSIEGELPSQATLEDALRKAKEWLATVEILQANENYPYFHTLENVVNRGKNIPFQLEELKRMEEHLTSARGWKQKTSRTFLKRNSFLELLEVLSPRAKPIMLVSNVGNSAEKLGSATAKSCAIYDEKQFTEDMGPAQMVVAFKNAEEKEISDMRTLRDTNQTKNPEKDKYCMCHQPFRGNMYKCQLCLDWFHAGCVRNYPNTCTTNSANSTPTKQNRNAAAASNQTSNAASMATLNGRARDREPKYLCESCQRSKRPRLETILTLLVSLQKLPIRLPEGEALQCLTERAMNWQDRARQVLETVEVVNALASIQKQQNIADSKNDEPRDVEHAYSVPVDGPPNSTAPTTPTPKPTNTAQNSTASKSTTGPLIQLQKSTSDKIDELMMEGDLLEVSLDETQYLWRLFNASKSDITDLALIRSKYNIMPQVNEALVSNIRKRHSDEHQNDAFLKKSRMRADYQSVDQRLTRQRLSDDDDDNDDDEDMEDIANFENELSRNDETADAHKTPTQKPKRGRKMTMTTKDTDAMCTTIEESTTILSDNVQLSLSAKKKKRGRKSVTNQTRQETNSKEDDTRNVVTASTSDEDEECSFANCIRPTGREVDWVQCDGGCNEWFHMLCVGLVKSQMKPDDEFICKKCKNKKISPATTASTTATCATAANNSTTASASKKLKSQTVNGNSSSGTAANGNGTTGAKKRLTRSKEDGNRDKSTVTNTNENSVDNSKENEPRPNNSTKSDKSDSQSISTSRPKVTEKTN